MSHKDALAQTDDFLKKFFPDGVKAAVTNLLPLPRPLTHEDYIPAAQLPDDTDEPEPEFENDFENFTPEEDAIHTAWEHRRENRHHEIFIAEMVAHGNRRMAYQRAYPGVSNATAYNGAYRLLANPKVAQRIRLEQLRIKKQSLEAIKASLDPRIADIEQKRVVLAQIIRGELKNEKEINKDGHTHTVKQLDNTAARMRAILLDNKMEELWLEAVNIPDVGMKFEDLGTP